jgi:hypothetical protein
MKYKYKIINAGGDEYYRTDEFISFPSGREERLFRKDMVESHGGLENYILFLLEQDKKDMARREERDRERDEEQRRRDEEQRRREEKRKERRAELASFLLNLEEGKEYGSCHTIIPFSTKEIGSEFDSISKIKKVNGRLVAVCELTYHSKGFGHSYKTSYEEVDITDFLKKLKKEVER